MLHRQSQSLKRAIRSTLRLISGIRPLTNRRHRELVEGFDQSLLPLQLTPPAAGNREQGIEIEADTLRWQCLKQIESRDLCALVEERLERHLNGLACCIVINQHQITDLIKQAPACPAVENLAGHAAVIDQRSLEQINHSLTTFFLEQIQPHTQLRGAAFFTTQPSP